jgi:ABC-2 type transport system permease protein
MTATTLAAPVRAATVPVTKTGRPARETFGRLVKSEFSKLRTIRSTWWMLGTIAVVTLAIIPLQVSGNPKAGSPEWAEWGFSARNTEGFWILDTALGIAQMMMFLGIIWGALAVTTEYGNGSIRTSMMAAPRRLPVLWAKAVAVGVTLALLAVVAGVASIAINRGTYLDQGFKLTLEGPEIRAFVGAVVLSVLAGLFGLMIGWLIKSSAAAITVSLGLTMVLPMIWTLLPDKQWVKDVYEYLPGSQPDQVNMQLIAFEPASGTGGWWGALGIFAAWVAVIGAIAMIRLKARDV